MLLSTDRSGGVEEICETGIHTGSMSIRDWEKCGRLGRSVSTLFEIEFEAGNGWAAGDRVCERAILQTKSLFEIRFYEVVVVDRILVAGRRVKELGPGALSLFERW